MPKMPERLIVTGCDTKTEWQLLWFIDTYYSHNSIQIAVADFGMSPEMKERIRQSNHPALFCYMDIPVEGKGWFGKPQAMLSAPGKKCFWIDTDCEVLGNLDRMFDHLEPNKLSMAIDKPWLKRRGELWHNSGVVGFMNKPDILKQWAEACKKNPQVGDQEVLHSMLNPITKMTYIKDLPNKYNWLRLQIENDNEDSPDKKIMHWTGEKGNDRIRGKMKVKEFMRRG